MPKELPTIHVGNIEKYQSSRSGSGLSREELLDEQDAMEQILVKNAAARGVSLMGAVETMRRSAAAAKGGAASTADGSAAAAVSATADGSAAAARGGKRKRADAVSSIAAVSAAAAVSATAAVSAAAAVSSAAAVVSEAGSDPCSEVAFSSRGRRLRPRQMSPDSDD
jgi:hypothetical protein